MKLALCEQMRKLDKAAIEQYKIPGIVLMENAAISIFNICKTLDAYKRKNVLIFCGTGNNGGDGFAIARHMRDDGASVSIVIVGEEGKIRGDALINYKICKNLGIDIEIFSGVKALKRKPENCELVIDAMLGTGVSGKLMAPIPDVIKIINESGKYILAVDCPTGGNADTGQINAECVRADMTVTLGLLKPGLLLYPLANYAGRVELGDIGAKAVFDNFKATHFSLNRQSAARLLPERNAYSHKGSYGKAAIVAGSGNMAGAAAYCAKAAYATGCGYVNICAPEGIIDTLQILAPQAITTPMPQRDGHLSGFSALIALGTINNYTTCLIGPGLGNNEETAEFVKEVIRNATVPLVIDADALNVIATEPKILKAAAFPPIITPHMLEMSRLTGIAVPQIQSDLQKTAMDFSKKYNCVTVLKDAVTVIACPGGATFINKGGVSALAKAGSGDVLAGIITALAGHGLASVEAAALGAYIHTQSGIAASHKFGDYSVSSEDIIGCIHVAIKELFDI